MEQEQIKFEQYKLYTQQKDTFIDRIFLTNRFYISLILILTVSVFFAQGLNFKFLSLPLVLSLMGILICILWWSNMDSYNFLIKIKFSKVIEELEKNLPTSPYQMEYQAIKEYREKKKAFLFTDLQKVFATLCFLFFLLVTLIEFVPIIVKQLV